MYIQVIPKIVRIHAIAGEVEKNRENLPEKLKNVLKDDDRDTLFR